jgi:serine phosphatase RsbU (regulator of sigma subunit)
MTIASAGHPGPLVIDGVDATFVSVPVGVPIGVRSPRPYEAVTVAVEPESTVLAFTDGLFERRGESVDIGLERVRRLAQGLAAEPLDRLLDHLVESLVTELDDDTALLGVRWRSWNHGQSNRETADTSSS